MISPQPVPATAPIDPERRRTDRRRRPTPMLSRYTLFGGRRAGDRRDAGDTSQYVDRYPLPVACAIVAIAALCALDAVFTLLHLQRGGGEANPIMDALIHRAGSSSFLVLKCIVTNAGLLVLCLHKNFQYVKLVIAILLAIYVALFGYHIYLTAISLSG
jgi:hypothetical protein